MLIRLLEQRSGQVDGKSWPEADWQVLGDQSGELTSVSYSGEGQSSTITGFQMGQGLRPI